MQPLRDIEDLRRQKRDTTWLWYPFLPAGKISVLVAEQGEGKTTMALTIATHITRGLPLPGMSGTTEPGNVIFQSGEDDYNETIFQRLETMDADLRRVSYIEDAEGSLSLSSEEFPRYITDKSTKLLVIDPIQSFIGRGYDMNRAADMRTLLNPLRITAAQTGCAILLIAHYNKTRGVRRLEHVMGSIDITNLARNVLGISHLKADPATRVMTQMKSTFVAKGTSILFTIDDKSLQLGEITTLSIEALQDQAASSQLEKACEIIIDMLDEGPMLSSKLERAVLHAGISPRTFDTAKKELGVKSKPVDRRWYSYFPDQGRNEFDGLG